MEVDERAHPPYENKEVKVGPWGVRLLPSAHRPGRYTVHPKASTVIEPPAHGVSRRKSRCTRLNSPTGAETWMKPSTRECEPLAMVLPPPARPPPRRHPFGKVYSPERRSRHCLSSGSPFLE